ncbi:MAG: hypothetical protein ACRD7E_01530, partial [Bryobacteraceae bacterium]
FLSKRAAAFAKLPLEKKELTDQDRIGYAAMRAWGRPLSAEETEEMLGFLAEYPEGTSAADGPPAEWVAFCRLLLVSNNFFYID